MAGSDAEERIRAKVESALRARRPDARIIHELVLTQGGERIDLAAIWPGGMILAEIKSEKDTLSRLQAQLKRAGRFGCEVWLCLAEKWRPAIQAMQERNSAWTRVPIRKGDEAFRYGYTVVTTPNPCHIPELSSTEVLVRYETDDGLSAIDMHPTWLARERILDPRALLNMLWAQELRYLTGLGTRASRGECIAWARENLTGRQIRERTCDALRLRDFPRADEPVWPAKGVA